MKLPPELGLYADFLETIPDGALLVDSKGQIVLANAASHTLFGFEPGDLGGRALGTLVPVAQRDAHAEKVSAYFAAPQRRPMATGMQLRALCAGGEEREVDIMLSPASVGEETYTVCIVHDMTVRRTLEAELEAALRRERQLARTDHLTGTANSRRFLESAQREIDRCHRYKRPFTIAYFDLDNFKRVNDTHGHATGDALLRCVANATRRQCRRTDTIARLGGDEFAILFPETGDEAARVAVAKIRDALLEEMRRNGWPVTFSIGVLTCNDPPENAADLIKAADDLMYSVKGAGKDAIRHGLFAH